MEWIQRIITFFRYIFCCCCCQDRRGTLFVFDFDQTITSRKCEDSTSSALVRKKMHLPLSVRNDYNAGNWQAYMQGVMDYIIFEENIPLNDIMENVKRLALLPGMESLLRRIAATVAKNKKNKLIIISGCNDLYIQTILDNLEPPIRPDKIISNTAEKAERDGKEMLIFKAYENQTACKNCPTHLCKGGALVEYVKKEGPFKRIYYSGNGTTDLCPATKLKERDTLFVRAGHRLSGLIAGGQHRIPPIDIKARIVYFNKGDEIEDSMEGLVTMDEPDVNANASGTN